MSAKIVFLDDSEDLRDAMTALLASKLSESCLTFDSLATLQECEDDVLNSQLVILDINLGPDQPTGIDAYNWLKESGFAGKVFFLTGHAGSHPLVTEATQSGARVWAKPIPTEVMFPAISEVLHEGDLA